MPTYYPDITNYTLETGTSSFKNRANICFGLSFPFSFYTYPKIGDWLKQVAPDSLGSMFNPGELVHYIPITERIFFNSNNDLCPGLLGSSGEILVLRELLTFQIAMFELGLKVNNPLVILRTISYTDPTPKNTLIKNLQEILDCAIKTRQNTLERSFLSISNIEEFLTLCKEFSDEEFTLELLSRLFPELSEQAKKLIIEHEKWNTLLDQLKHWSESPLYALLSDSCEFEPSPFPENFHDISPPRKYNLLASESVSVFLIPDRLMYSVRAEWIARISLRYHASDEKTQAFFIYFYGLHSLAFKIPIECPKLKQKVFAFALDWLQKSPSLPKVLFVVNETHIYQRAFCHRLKHQYRLGTKGGDPELLYQSWKHLDTTKRLSKTCRRFILNSLLYNSNFTKLLYTFKRHPNWWKQFLRQFHINPEEGTGLSRAYSLLVSGRQLRGIFTPEHKIKELLKPGQTNIEALVELLNSEEDVDLFLNHFCGIASIYLVNHQDRKNRELLLSRSFETLLERSSLTQIIRVLSLIYDIELYKYDTVFQEKAEAKIRATSDFGPQVELRSRIFRNANFNWNSISLLYATATDVLKKRFNKLFDELYYTDVSNGDLVFVYSLHGTLGLPGDDVDQDYPIISSFDRVKTEYVNPSNVFSTPGVCRPLYLARYLGRFSKDNKKTARVFQAAFACTEDLLAEDLVLEIYGFDVDFKFLGKLEDSQYAVNISASFNPTSSQTLHIYGININLEELYLYKPFLGFLLPVIRRRNSSERLSFSEQSSIRFCFDMLSSYSTDSDFDPADYLLNFPCFEKASLTTDLNLDLFSRQSFWVPGLISTGRHYNPKTAMSLFDDCDVPTLEEILDAKKYNGGFPILASKRGPLSKPPLRDYPMIYTFDLYSSDEKFFFDKDKSLGIRCLFNRAYFTDLRKHKNMAFLLCPSLGKNNKDFMELESVGGSGEVALPKTFPDYFLTYPHIHPYLGYDYILNILFSPKV